METFQLLPHNPVTGFGVYVHVPFCSSRCGYCDFNTYTPSEIGSALSPDIYLAKLETELELAAALRAAAGDHRVATTVFIGGGTPSLLGATGLIQILQAVKNTTGLSPSVEITTEANPESTDPEFFERLVDAGFNRLSLGMQSASAKVLAVLERQHTADRAFHAVSEAHQAGFRHINLDMIYGTPTETDDDVKHTLDKVLETEVDHVSAYSLIVEEGTRMARKVRTGQLPEPAEDTYADRYELIDARLRDAGFSWYEVSNWAKDGGECRHNLGYWLDQDWWGAGPGAHSHINNMRFSNQKHPARYCETLTAGKLPINDWEILSPTQRREERIMLGLRLSDGLPVSMFTPAELHVAHAFADNGLVQINSSVSVTDRGRLLADGIIADILVAGEKV